MGLLARFGVRHPQRRLVNGGRDMVHFHVVNLPLPKKNVPCTEARPIAYRTGAGVKKKFHCGLIGKIHFRICVRDGVRTPNVDICSTNSIVLLCATIMSSRPTYRETKGKNGQWCCYEVAVNGKQQRISRREHTLKTERKEPANVFDEVERHRVSPLKSKAVATTVISETKTVSTAIKAHAHSCVTEKST
jgi:hypothetical protein